MRYVSIDIETLGLSEECDIIEFGAVVDDLENPLLLEDLPIFHAFFKKDRYTGEAYAMSMHTDILRKISQGSDSSDMTLIYPRQLGKLFKSFLKDLDFKISERNSKITINVAGKNFQGFDAHFLRKHTDFYDHINVRSRILDPGPLYYQKGDKNLPSLQECLTRAEIDSHVNHTSVEDSLDVIRLIRKAYL